MHRSEFDFDVITTPASPPKPVPKRTDPEPAPARPREERDSAEPPASNESR